MQARLALEFFYFALVDSCMEQLSVIFLLVAFATLRLAAGFALASNPD